MITLEEDKQALLWFYDRYSRVCKGRSSKRRPIESQVTHMIQCVDKHII